MDCFCSIFETGKKVWEVTGGCCINFINLGTNINRLKLDTNSLSGRAKDRNAEADARLSAEPGKIKSAELEAWLKEVQVIEEDVQRLEREFAEERNFFKRVWLAQRVPGKIEEVENVKAKGMFSDGLVSDASGKLIPIEVFFSQAASARNFNKVWKYLIDGEITRIGVVGMGGVGKTTIMKAIHNEIAERATGNFDKVIWVTVSKEFTVRKIQDAMAMKLDPDKKSNFWSFKDENEMDRATELCTMLSSNRYLLILDDVWKPFPLDKVGVSKSRSATLVLTTRSKDVCAKMDCEPVEVELLNEQEAKDLFMETVALPDDKLAPKVKEIAETVAKECARLPLAIITVARNMRKKEDLHAWREQLRKISRREIRDDERDVLELLKFSYSRLENEKFQKCFLYCAMYPEDFSIPENELIEYWIVEGLIDEMDSREAMFDEGHFILNELINIYLLERCQTSYVRMHDLIRDMSLQITSTSPRFIVHSGDQALSEVPFDVWSQDPVKVSLMNCYINVLPSSPPICRSLTTLLLRGNYRLQVIPDSFFLQMSHLEVLDLSGTWIRSLPESISDLGNLHALLAAHCCELQYVPSLEKLKELKELNLCGSKIWKVPEGLEELVNLRNLDLYYTQKLESFDSWKLRRLSKLQRLRIDFSGVEVSAADLLCLNKLEVVCAKFQNGEELISYLDSPQCQRLEKYWLYAEPYSLGYSYNPKEEIGKKVGVVGAVVGRQVFPNNVEILELRRCKFDIKIGSSDIMPWKNTKDLRIFALAQCDGIELIFSENCQTPLTSVEEFRLFSLHDLRVLFHEVAPVGGNSFKLKKLKIDFCSGIKNIFPAMLLQNNFPNLEELRVFSCDNVKEIIVDEDVEMSRKTITLPNLKTIALSYLRALESIYKGTMVGRSLEEIKVVKCPKLKRLPFSCSHTDDCQQHASPALVFPSVEKLVIEELPDLRVLFHEVAPAGDISFKLRELEIYSCSGIKNIFPAMLLQNNLPNLEELIVKNCENVKEIIVDEDVEMRRKTITPPNLKKITLSRLPALESIYKGTMVGRSLEEIKVVKCPKLKRLPFSCSHTDDCQQHASPAPALRLIQGEPEWQESLEWDDPDTKTVFQPFFDRIFF